MKKFMYEAPSVEVVDMELDGTLMQTISGGTIDSGGGGGEG